MFWGINDVGRTLIELVAREILIKAEEQGRALRWLITSTAARVQKSTCDLRP